MVELSKACNRTAQGLHVAHPAIRGLSLGDSGVLQMGESVFGFVPIWFHFWGTSKVQTRKHNDGGIFFQSNLLGKPPYATFLVPPFFEN